MTLPHNLHLWSYHLCAQDLTLTLKSVIQLGRFCSRPNADENLWGIKTKLNKCRTFSTSKLGTWFDDMLAAGNLASASRRLGNRKLSEIASEVEKWKKDENLWSIKTKPNKWRTFSTSKLGTWFDDMLAVANIALASRRLGNRKLSEIESEVEKWSTIVDERQKNSKYKKKWMRKSFNIQTGKMILWDASSQELNFLS